MEEFKRKIQEYVDSVRDELLEVSRYIYKNPEVGFKEKKASLKLVEVLRKHGFKVLYPIGGLETAFQAIISSGSDEPHIAILAEYDALPDLGHACGHNLIATAALGAGFAITQTMPPIKGRVSIIGTPAEEVLANSGKMKLIDAGIFKDVDIAMIAHPHGKSWLEKPFLAVDEISVRFTGKSSHAASAPHLGINAFDAMQLTFIGINFLRQQLRQDVRIHWGDLKISGAKNVIPDASSATISVRALDDEYTKEIRNRVINCIKGAALMAGCNVHFEVSEGFRAMKQNKYLTTLFSENIRLLGVSLDELPQDGRAASTDMGNVSRVVPSIHPFYKIKEQVTPHTVEFREAANTEVAFEATLNAAKAMAMTVVDLLSNPEALNQVKKEFESI